MPKRNSDIKSYGNILEVECDEKNGCAVIRSTVNGILENGLNLRLVLANDGTLDNIICDLEAARRRIRTKKAARPLPPKKPM